MLTLREPSEQFFCFGLGVLDRVLYNMFERLEPKLSKHREQRSEDGRQDHDIHQCCPCGAERHCLDRLLELEREAAHRLPNTLAVAVVSCGVA